MSVMPLEKVLYTARVHTAGGREGGSSRSDDGHLDIKVSPPGHGDGTNPEQLFAAGWSNCFLSAVKIAAAKRKIRLVDAVIDVEVDLGLVENNYTLAARLNVTLPGIDRETGESLIETAHQLCPYSRGTRGNINVVTTLK